MLQEAFFPTFGKIWKICGESVVRGSGTTDQCKTSCRLKLLMALYFPAGKEPTCRSSNHKGLLARYNIVVLGGVAKRWSRKTPSLAKPRRLVQLKSRENLKSWATRDREDVSSRERENEIYIVIVKFSTKENVSHQRLCDSYTIKSTTTREIFSHQRELKASHQRAHCEELPIFPSLYSSLI